MSKVSEQMIVPFTAKSFLGFLVLLIVLSAPLWWTRLHASAKVGEVKSKPDLTGQWVGTAHITSYANGYNPATALDEQGSFLVKLEMYDGILERYRGQGALQIGDQTPRDLKITGLSLGDWFTPERAQAAGGGLRLEANLGGDLKRDRPSDTVTTIQGSASSDRIQFSTVATLSGYVFKVDLHRKK